MRSEYIRSTAAAGPPIPILGTSWYRRGASYWARRAAVSLVMLLILALFAVAVGAIIEAIATSLEGTVRVVVLAAAGATVVASVIAAARRSEERFCSSCR